MSRRRLPLPLPLTRRSFSVSEAIRLGQTRGGLQTGFFQPHHGARAHRPATGLLQACEDALPIMKEGWAFSHVTAAALWGLPSAARAHDERALPLHISAQSGRGPRREGIVGHRISATTVMQVSGFPVLAPAEVWWQCASLLEVDDVVAMGDALIGRWSPHAAARAQPLLLLNEAILRHEGERGTARAREALGLIRPDCWSPKETAIRLVLQRAGCPDPELNVKRFDDAGTYLGRPDLSWPDAKVAVEYEGDHHRLDPSTFAEDIDRRERFADAGWRTIRATRTTLASRHAEQEFVSRVLRRVT